MTSIAKRKAVLENRLQELNARLHEIDEELESHHSKDWEELAVERETDEVLEGMGLSGQAEIKAINAALVRIQNGEYGDCVACGAQILPERLDLLPYAPLCRKCANARASGR
ncbi:MAG: TraR/DksA family transcriptional regulator [Marinosulfonomonas sp.]|nr:TraR/DksA family transcriptional regulator [Marinosulfonomonas sp.]